MFKLGKKNSTCDLINSNNKRVLHCKLYPNDSAAEENHEVRKQLSEM